MGSYRYGVNGSMRFHDESSFKTFLIILVFFFAIHNTVLFLCPLG
jgi:hypothetical protein